MLTLENVDAESPDIRVSDSAIHLWVLLRFRYLVSIHDLVGDLLNHPFGQFFIDKRDEFAVGFHTGRCARCEKEI